MGPRPGFRDVRSGACGRGLPQLAGRRRGRLAERLSHRRKPAVAGPPAARAAIPDGRRGSAGAGASPGARRRARRGRIQRRLPPPRPGSAREPRAKPGRRSERGGGLRCGVDRRPRGYSVAYGAFSRRGRRAAARGQLRRARGRATRGALPAPGHAARSRRTPTATLRARLDLLGAFPNAGAVGLGRCGVRAAACRRGGLSPRGDPRFGRRRRRSTRGRGLCAAFPRRGLSHARPRVAAAGCRAVGRALERGRAGTKHHVGCPHRVCARIPDRPLGHSLETPRPARHSPPTRRPIWHGVLRHATDPASGEAGRAALDAGRRADRHDPTYGRQRGGDSPGPVARRGPAPADPGPDGAARRAGYERRGHAGIRRAKDPGPESGCGPHPLPQG